jgi:hypothetical protein
MGLVERSRPLPGPAAHLRASLAGAILNALHYSFASHCPALPRHGKALRRHGFSEARVWADKD